LEFLALQPLIDGEPVVVTEVLPDTAL